jgi:hypothetical protein
MLGIASYPNRQRGSVWWRIFFGHPHARTFIDRNLNNRGVGFDFVRRKLAMVAV